MVTTSARVSGSGRHCTASDTMEWDAVRDGRCAVWMDGRCWDPRRPSVTGRQGSSSDVLMESAGVLLRAAPWAANTPPGGKTGDVWLMALVALDTTHEMGSFVRFRMRMGGANTMRTYALGPTGRTDTFK